VDVFGKRYGEVLLVRPGEAGPEATVFNSFPLNDCPQQLWSKLDTEAIARENDAQMVLNGPRVNRKALFTFDAGRPVFELVDPDGRSWVMQTWNQTVDKGLSLDDLPELASHLELPAGWSYESRSLASPLHVDTRDQDAQMTQDDLANSYSLVDQSL
jgi:hypothetical protein